MSGSWTDHRVSNIWSVLCEYIMSIDAEEKIRPKLSTLAQYNEETSY